MMTGLLLTRSQKLAVQHSTLEVENLFSKLKNFTPVWWLLVIVTPYFLILVAKGLKYVYRLKKENVINNCEKLMFKRNDTLTSQMYPIHNSPRLKYNVEKYFRYMSTLSMLCYLPRSMPHPSFHFRIPKVLAISASVQIHNAQTKGKQLKLMVKQLHKKEDACSFFLFLAHTL